MKKMFCLLLFCACAVLQVGCQGSAPSGSGSGEAPPADLDNTCALSTVSASDYQVVIDEYRRIAASTLENVDIASWEPNALAVMAGYMLSESLSALPVAQKEILFQEEHLLRLWHVLMDVGSVAIRPIDGVEVKKQMGCSEKVEEKL